MLMWAGDKARALEAFEKALEDAPGTVRALEFLLPIYDETKNHARFVVVAEQLASILAGPAAMGPWRERLAEAYEALRPSAGGRRAAQAVAGDAGAAGAARALAEAQGLMGEALQLHERLTEDPAQLEAILRQYLDGQLVVFAVRLAERLFQAGQLSLDGEAAGGGAALAHVRGLGAGHLPLAGAVAAAAGGRGRRGRCTPRRWRPATTCPWRWRAWTASARRSCPARRARRRRPSPRWPCPRASATRCRRTRCP